MLPVQYVQQLSHHDLVDPVAGSESISMALMLVVRAAWAFILSAADALVRNLLPVGFAPCGSPDPGTSSEADAAAADAVGIDSIVDKTLLTTGVNFVCSPLVSLLASPSFSPTLSPFSDIMMAEPSDSDVTLSDDELELLQGVGRGSGFVVGKAVGAVPFVFGVTGVTGLVRVKPQSELIKADQRVVQVRFLYLTLHVVLTVLTFPTSMLLTSFCSSPRLSLSVVTRALWR